METGRGAGWEMARAVWSRRKWLAILVLAGSLSTVVSLTLALPNLYRSTATVLVERPQLAETFVRSSVTGELETRLQTVSQQILSRARLKELITRFELYPALRKRAPLDAVTERMRRDIQLDLKGVDQTGGRGATIAFTLSYLGKDPETVARVTNTLASFYVEETLRVRERQAAGTTEFLKLQLDSVKKRLDAQERRVSEFKARYIGELPQQVAPNLATLERLNGQLRLNDANQTRLRERRAALVKQLAETPAVGAPPSPDTTAARIARLNQELAQLRTRFTDKYPDVIRLKAEIAALERQLAETSPDGQPTAARATPVDPALVRQNEALSQLEREMTGLKAEEDTLRRDLAAYQRRVENAPQREQELQELSRDYEATKELYYSLVRRYEDAELAESMEHRQKGEQFRLLDPAIPSQAPAAPNRRRLLLVGTMLSLAVAAGAAVLAERLDTSFHTVDDLRAFTRVGVLASIPRIAAASESRRRRRRAVLAVAGAAVGLALIAGASYYVAHGNDDLVWMLVRNPS